MAVRDVTTTGLDRPEGIWRVWRDWRLLVWVTGASPNEFDRHDSVGAKNFVTRTEVEFLPGLAMRGESRRVGGFHRMPKVLAVEFDAAISPTLPRSNPDVFALSKAFVCEIDFAGIGKPCRKSNLVCCRETRSF